MKPKWWFWFLGAGPALGTGLLYIAILKQRNGDFG